MNEAEFQHLLEAGWQRPLSPEEQARLQSWLVSHPEAHADLEAEAGLTQALLGLANAPLPSNFTSQVLANVDRSESVHENKLNVGGWKMGWALIRSRWARWAAVAGLLTVLGVAAFWNVRHDLMARSMARSIEVAGAISSLEHPEALQDFEVIHHLSFVPVQPGDGAVDLELLAALQ